MNSNNFNQQSAQASITPPQYRTLADLYEYKQSTAPAGEGTAAAAQLLPPITNRGVSDSQKLEATAYDALETVEINPKGNGAFSLVRIPKPNLNASADYAFIDYINFTVKTNHFLDLGITDYDVIASLSHYLNKIFGYGVTGKRANGLNFYESSFDLGINGWGTVCIGGQNETILVTVKGQGLLAARDGWEQRLYTFLSTYDDSKITRIDLAYDKFESERTVDDYLGMYHADMFKQRGQQPNVEQAGNWINPNGKGRTLYIGSRSSGKLLRIYEKGLQLSGGFTELFPNWVRVEIEFSAKQRVLPFEMLINPGQFLSGAYPALNDLCVAQQVIETKKKIAKTTVEKALEVTRNQFGRYIWTFVELFGADEAIKKLTHKKNILPEKLDLGDYKSAIGLNIQANPTFTLDEVFI